MSNTTMKIIITAITTSLLSSCYVSEIPETASSASRIELIEQRVVDGAYLRILRDKDTARTYMSYAGGIIELEQ